MLEFLILRVTKEIFGLLKKVVCVSFCISSYELLGFIKSRILGEWYANISTFNLKRDFQFSDIVVAKERGSEIWEVFIVTHVETMRIYKETADSSFF